jgi:hypothetical protein
MLYCTALHHPVEGGKKEHEVESEGRRLSIGPWTVWTR